MTAPQSAIVDAIIRMEGADSPKSVNSAILRSKGLHNPGHIIWSEWSENHGAVRVWCGFRYWAAWPTRREGEEAIASLLQTYAAGNPRMTIRDAVFKYAPPSENNSALYATMLGQWTGLDVNAPLASIFGLRCPTCGQEVKHE